jgi:hypothetical protein
MIDVRCDEYFYRYVFMYTYKRHFYVLIRDFQKEESTVNSARVDRFDFARVCKFWGFILVRSDGCYYR